ncbi:MAG: hypothetical protein JWQ35_51, partial [Bacteriovoracaceae bacterium]|nr:hypothetical protein [Bacteriovoracaceae bacterium]
SKNGEFGGFFKILNSVALEIIFAKKMWVIESPKVPRLDPFVTLPEQKFESEAAWHSNSKREIGC